MNAKDMMIEAVVGKIVPCGECAEMDLTEDEVRPTFYDGTHEHCPDCGTVFHEEEYPYCRLCRVRWD
jgi:hypothetical protein